MTLVEVLISLFMVSLISLCIAAMMSATSYGTDSRRDPRQLAVRSQQVRLRMDDAIRNAQQILAVGSNPTYLVIWRGDSNRANESKDQINLSELQIIELGGDGRLLSYTKDTPANDVTLTADFYAQKAQLTPAEWCQSATGLSLAFDQADPSAARLVTWRLSLTAGELQESIVSSVTLRHHGSLDEAE